jgi:hypothetical protein
LRRCIFSPSAFPSDINRVRLLITVGVSGHFGG